MKNPRSVVSVAMSPELLARLDAKRGGIPRSRYIQNLIRRAVYDTGLTLVAATSVQAGEMVKVRADGKVEKA